MTRGQVAARVAGIAAKKIIYDLIDAARLSSLAEMQDGGDSTNPCEPGYIVTPWPRKKAL